MATWLKRSILVILAALVIGGFWLALRERPVPVDMAVAQAGPMAVHIEEEGVARVRDVYAVSAPIAGHLDRTTIEEGQSVEAGKTVIASIQPQDPPLLDERTIAELRASMEAANSAIALAEVDRTRAQMAYDLATSEYERASRLAKTRVISDSQLERTYSDMKLKEAEVASAEAAIKLRQAERESVAAKLKQPESVGSRRSNGDCCVEVYSPIDGVVLSVAARSEQSVTQGVKIAEIGDTSNLEVAVDLLSSDAPKVHPGTRASITEWGGEKDIPATVRLIEPSAFTKVSALGIEEQRVNAIIDLEEVPERLGHGYRVIARIEIWSSDSALQVPLGALFRDGSQWAVFTVRGERAAMTPVGVGQLNDDTAQILSGLEAGDRVILYPSDLVDDGVLVSQR